MNTDRPRIYLEREPQVSELSEPTIKLELTEAELALLMEFSLAHILELENKLGQLERSESLHSSLNDSETVARVRGRQNRIRQLLEIDQRLDYKLYLASKS
jgi:hypothetical protein